MRIQIESADLLYDSNKHNNQRLIKKYPQLKKYNFNKKDSTIEINTIEDLLKISKEIDERLIISYEYNNILIYDTWLE